MGLATPGERREGREGVLNGAMALCPCAKPFPNGTERDSGDDRCEGSSCFLYFGWGMKKTAELAGQILNYF